MAGKRGQRTKIQKERKYIKAEKVRDGRRSAPAPTTDWVMYSHHAMRRQPPPGLPPVFSQALARADKTVVRMGSRAVLKQKRLGLKHMY